MLSDRKPSDSQKPSDMMRVERRGTIRVGGARMALLDIAGGFFMIRKILEQDLGVVERDLMQRAGMEGAASFLASATQSGIVRPGPDGFRTALDAYASAGFGDFQLLLMDWDNSWVEVSCRDTFEGWACVRNHDPRKDVTCDYTRGVLAGFMRQLRNPDDVDVSSITCIETSCIGKGDGVCRFVVGPAEKLQKSGHTVPEALPPIREQLDELHRQLERQHLELREVYSFQTLVGKSRAMRAVYSLISRVGDSGAPVLIRGEAGTGKRHVAHAIHLSGDRSGRPFISFDCAPLAGATLEAELFGVERRDRSPRIGALESASDGTLLLREIGALPLSAQEQLQAALRTGLFLRLGGQEPVPLRARIISTSERDLTDVLDKGGLLRPLFATLSAVSIELPPLRERLEDLPLLADHFIEKHIQSSKTPRPRLAKDALAALLRYRWPGNIAELASMIERAALLSDGKELSLAHFSLPSDVPPAAHYAGGSLDETMDKAEKQIVLEALEHHRWRRGETAKHLNITRATLYNKMRKYGILKSNDA